MLKKLFWLLLGVVISFLMLMPVVKAEVSVPHYGFMENSNEISAKNELIGLMNPANIYDYNTSPNQNGEAIQNGHYYVPISYNGGYNGTDTDYLLLSDFKNEVVKEVETNNTETTTKLAQGISTNNQRSDDINNRIAELERPQFILGLVLRHVDTRKWQINSFVDVSTTRGNIDRAGVRFTYKIGKSYEETRLDELQARLDKLEGIKTQKENEDNVVMYKTENGMGMKSRF